MPVAIKPSNTLH